jgi:hypothetical protein
VGNPAFDVQAHHINSRHPEEQPSSLLHQSPSALDSELGARVRMSFMVVEQASEQLELVHKTVTTK